MADPFIVHTPEQLTPQAIAENFVEMYTDFPKLKEPVNMFIHGARGSGKSIMLRSLELRVQNLLDVDHKSNLQFFAVHVPIKDNFFGNPEYMRLSGWKSTTVGEHLLSVYVMLYFCKALGEAGISLTDNIKNEFIELWEDCGGKEQVEVIQDVSDFYDLARFCDRETRRVRQYYVRLPEAGDADIYSGVLTAYNDFLLPFARFCQGCNLPLVSESFCFMLDDADNLPEAMQKVLNSWISTRTASTVCFKVTTQLGYKTYRTIDNRVIESPHDYSEVNIGSVYTSSKGSFSKRIRAIVSKRLANAGIETPAEDFFPSDVQQETRRDEVWADLSEGKTEPYIELRGGGPSRNRDLAQRYTTPALMRELSSGKSSHTYSYSGLQSLTDLSSGVVRWFLEPAGQMYHQVESLQDAKPESIPVGVQDDVLMSWSRGFREKLNADPGHGGADFDGASLQSMGHSKENYQLLANLIDAIGWLCRERLLDKSASEQRNFSFALSDNPSEKLSEILNLGIRMGYLQKADLASKSKMGGRRPRYILSRRLGPYYRLDVSGYAAHLSVTAGSLDIAMYDPREFLRKRGETATAADLQQSLDFEG